jgi:hypothetical protein
MADEGKLVRSRPFSVRLIPLPSSVDPDLEEPITHTKSVKVDFPISDLTIDPTQDLIVASEFMYVPQDASLQTLSIKHR